MSKVYLLTDIRSEFVRLFTGGQNHGLFRKVRHRREIHDLRLLDMTMLRAMAVRKVVD